MARSVTTALLSFAVIALACAGPASDPAGDEPVQDEAASNLVEPWLSMGLPTSNGAVLYSDAAGMMVSHSQTFQETSDAYANALKGGGFVVAGDYGETNFTALAFQRGTTNIGLMVSGDASGALVLLEDLGQVPEQESNMASARRGERKMPAAARRGERPQRTVGERPTQGPRNTGTAGTGGSGGGTKTLSGSGGSGSGGGKGGSSGGTLSGSGGSGGSGGSSGGSLGGGGSSSGGSLGK